MLDRGGGPGVLLWRPLMRRHPRWVVLLTAYISTVPVSAMRIYIAFAPSVDVRSVDAYQSMLNQSSTAL